MKNYIFIYLLLISFSLQAQKKFECGAAYLTVGESGATRIYKLEIGNISIAPSLLVTVKGVNLNAFGLKRQNGLMYAANSTKNADNTTSIYSVDADGKATELARLPLNSSYGYYAADVSPDGRYFTILGNMSSPALFYRIDLTSPTYSYEAIALTGVDISAPDIAYSVNGDKLYVVNDDTKELLEIDLDNKKVLQKYPTGYNGSLLFSGFFGFNCALFGYVRSSSAFIRIESEGKKQPKGKAIIYSTVSFANASGLDGCSCPQNLKFQQTIRKADTPNDSCALDYRFVLTLDNECNADQNNVSLLQPFHPDFTIKSITYQPYAANVVSGVGTSLLQIDALNIPSKKDSIVIIATLAKNHKDSVYGHQALLKKLSYPDGTLYDQVSDNPSTIKINDSTFVKNVFNLHWKNATYTICNDIPLTLKPITSSSIIKSYLWNTGATTSSIQVKEAGIYAVTISDGCIQKKDTIAVDKVTFKVDIGEDTQLYPTDSLIVIPTFSNNNLKVSAQQWMISTGGKLSCTQCPVAVVRPYGDKTTIQYTAKTTLGCEASDELLITTRRAAYFPNAFSPDGDGTNDYLYIQTEKDVRIVQFDIYNRWGDKVFATSPDCNVTNAAQCGWNGRFKGLPQKSDTYTYFAILDFGDGIFTPYKGNIFLY